VSAVASHSPFVSPEEYLAGEEVAEQKHEFLNGMVYAMAGARQIHLDIASNILGSLFAQLRGKPCRPYGSDMLLKVQHGDDLRFYYPDVSIVCRRAGRDARVQAEPTVLFEILSESTMRIDTGEKRMAYLTIPTLEAYVIVDSQRCNVTVWRRKGDRWDAQSFTAPDTPLVFTASECQLTIAEIYEETAL
jgi:Uma2 family endonuclease